MTASAVTLETKFSPSKTKISLAAATGLVFVIGVSDLWRGGITVSAFMLAIGYCVMLPALIWVGDDGARPRRGAAPSEDETPYLSAAIVGVVILALYLMTMAPSTAMWDTSEYIAAAYTFGLPHPPGNPFFVIIGRVFSLLPIASNVAARINVLAAISSAASAALWFLVTDQILRVWLSTKWLRLVAATAAALIGATSFTVWNQSVVNEKVYTVSLVGMAIVSWLAVRWSADPDHPKADRLLVMIAYLCGLGYANHMAGMLPAPAVALAVLVRRPATITRWRVLLSCVIAILVGLSPFATQPIRAAHFPAMNEGEPTACRVELKASCAFSKQTYDLFMYNFNRGQYGKPDLSSRQASFGEQLAMWWMYFRWQWVRDPQETAPFVQSLLASAFFVLALTGGWVHFKRDRRTFWYFGALMFTTTLLLIFYLNFKLGASQDPTSPSEHEVRDRDYFFLWSFSAWGVWAAIGLAYVWETLAAMLGTEERREGRDTITEPTMRSWQKASPALMLAIVPLFSNWSAASRAHHRTTRNVAADLLNSVEPYGVLVTVGDNDTFPLWYAQEVEGIRRDVVIANTSLLNTDWYGRQLIRRPIYDYDAAKGPSIYRNQAWKKPTSPPMHMTLDEADSVPAYYQLPKATPFNAGPYHTIIDPQRLHYGVLERADALVLRMIQDSWSERPFYFARSSASYPSELGFANNVLAQGLASKLFVPPAQSTRDTMLISGDGWIDVARTRALWDSVFTGYQSTIAEGHWVDRPSASMPLLYVFAGAELSEALRANGDVNAARSILATSRSVAETAGFPDFARSLAEPTQSAPATGDSSGVTLRMKPSDQPKVQSTDPAVVRKKR
ncbi:MAG TPA: DUF2723 domain-containing protein [Gemmatimonadaceae bacterium]|jgi:hypothetical protein